MEIDVHKIELLSKANAIFLDAHKNQTDKAGKPYIRHPMQVASTVSVFHPGNANAFIVALLHDVVEDCGDRYPLKVLAKTFPPEVIEAIDAITKRKGETQDQYLDRVGENYLATIVKIADLHSNSDEKRLSLLQLEVRQRLQKKYKHATDKLMRIWEEVYNEH